MSNSVPLLGYSAFPVFDSIAQNVGYNTDDGGAPWGASGGLVSFASDVQMFQVNVVTPGTLPSGTGIALMGINLVNDTATTVRVAAFLRIASTGVTLVYNAMTIATLSTKANYNIGFYVSDTGPNAGKVGITVDGFDYGYQSDTPFATDAGMYIITNGDFAGTGFTNKDISETLITAAPLITESPPAGGADDICDNPI
jgi:hypothetical protein